MTKPFYNKQETIHTQTFYTNLTLDYYNTRLRVDDYRGNVLTLLEKVHSLAHENQFEKIIIKAKTEDIFFLLEKGFMLEAIITKYFSGSDALMMTKYLSVERRHNSNWVDEDNILASIMKTQLDVDGSERKSAYLIRKGTSADAKKLADLYRSIFKVYPTPLNEPEYIERAMNESAIFYVAEDNGSIISAASAEINHKYYNAELTDCATDPAYRKHGLMKVLLLQLEKELLNCGIYCTYSIARALSYGMNACFYQLGYSYTGRLTNNCNIYDKIEDMNVWVKDLSKNDAGFLA